MRILIRSSPSRTIPPAYRIYSVHNLVLQLRCKELFTQTCIEGGRDTLIFFRLLQWVQRVTLKDLMPDAKSVFKLLFKEVSIQEPAFNDTIILYRRDADIKKAESEDEKKPMKDASDVST